MSALIPFAPQLWIAQGPTVRFFGFRYPTRMAVLRLADGGLFLWSPVAGDDALKAAVRALGPVRHLVSPNKLHHLYLAEWAQAFPEARVWASPGLARKRPDLVFAGHLDDTPPPDWRDDIDQALFGGSVALTEIVFFHRASRTALFCDLIQNFPPGWFGGWRDRIARADGIMAPNHGPPREWRASFMNRARARHALDRIRGWRPQRVVIAHGGMAEADGERFIAHAFGWLR